MSMNWEINYFIYFVTGHISGRSYGAFFIFLHLVLQTDRDYWGYGYYLAN